MERRLANDDLATSPRRAGARAHLRAMGLDERDWSRPLVGIATTWTGTMPCNLGQRALAERVATGVRAAGGTPLEFNTIAVNEGKDERRTEGVAAPVAAAPEAQPVPVLPTESTGGGRGGGNSKGAITPDVAVPEVPEVAAPAPVAEVKPGRGRKDPSELSVVAPVPASAAAPSVAAAPVGPVADPPASATAAPAPQSKRRSR